jgi:hypothetical protein
LAQPIGQRVHLGGEGFFSLRRLMRLVQTYLTRVRRRWIKTIKMMTTSTPETTRISIVVSISSLSLSFFLTAPGFTHPGF